MIKVLNFLVCVFSISLNGSLEEVLKVAYGNFWKVTRFDTGTINNRVPFDISYIHISFDYDKDNKKIVSLSYNRDILILSDPEPNEYRSIPFDFNVLRDKYQRDIVFHKGEIFFIQNSSLYHFSQKTNIKKSWNFPSEYFTSTLNPDSQHLLLLTKKNSFDLSYGSSKSILFKMVESSDGSINLSCGDYESASYYLQGKKEECIEFSFVTTTGSKKNFYLNPKIFGIFVDTDVANKENPKGHYCVQQDVPIFYKIRKMQDGVPLSFVGIRFVFNHPHFDINHYILPQFTQTDSCVEISQESVSQLIETKLFENFSFNEWEFKLGEATISQQGTKKSFLTRKNLFYSVSMIAILYTFASLFNWFFKYRL